ncbi:MAG TPA: copper homeostasis membrane protein CopD [Parvibaculum sp.]|jgi:putative copper resistance protein D
MEVALVLCATVQFATAMTLFGGSLFRLLLSRATALDAALVRCLRMAALFAWISAAGWLMLEAANFGTGWSDALNPSVLFAVVTDTYFGHLWAVRLTISLMLMLLVQALPSRSAYGVVTGLAAIFLGSLALTGHALMDNGWLHPLSQMVHLLAGGAWIGALPPLIIALRQPVSAEGDALAVEATQLFAPLGSLAVAFVVASGLINGWLLVGGFSGLFFTTYGQVLLAKLALVGGMLICAAINRFRLAPGLALLREGRARLRRVVTIEIGLSLAVLGAASLLGTLQPVFR